MAEGEGFEPPFPGRKAVFKTAALNPSAIPPFAIFNTGQAHLSTSRKDSRIAGFPVYENILLYLHRG
jgi:hypothetical protein